MREMFNMDNPFWSVINRIIDIVYLSILWTICSLPLVTIGSTSAALYYSIVKTVRMGRSYSSKEFFYSLKMNIKKGCLIQVVFILFTVAMLFSNYPMLLLFLRNREISNTVLFVIACIKAFILIALANWIFPILSRFDDSVIKMFGASFLQVVTRFPQTLLCVIIIIGGIIICLEEPLLLAVVPGTEVLILSYIIEPSLRGFTDQSSFTDSEDKWFID